MALSLVPSTVAQQIVDYEGRPIGAIDITFEGFPPDPVAEAEFRRLILLRPNEDYSAVAIRDSLQSLFERGQVASARVEARVTDCPAPQRALAGPPVCLRFIIRRQIRVAEVVLELGVPARVPEDELRARLNLLEPGSPVSESTLRTNADLIQVFLRDRGFFRAEVDYETRPMPGDPTGTRSSVIFRIRTGEQARVGALNLNITGFDPSAVLPTLRSRQGELFSREVLGQDVTRIRRAIIDQGYLAPEIDVRDSLDPAGNAVINITGVVGPRTEVVIRGYTLSERRARELLPVKREGTIDYSAIVEGARRLRNRLQEQGYFFTEVTPLCSVTPPSPDIIGNGTEEACQGLSPQELSGRTVTIVYSVEQNRRFRLTDIRIEGTDKLTYRDVEDELRSQTATILAIIPVLGYGRGYTSRDLIEEDLSLIKARMRDLGYRKAEVTYREGVSIDGENLIITFVVEEGPLTRVTGITVRGNQVYTEPQIREEFQAMIVGAPYSRVAARSDADRIINLYARDGYINARVDFSLVELPNTNLPGGDIEENVRVIYTIGSEGDKVLINAIRINGNIITSEQAIREAIPLVEGEVLRLFDLTETERILYETDAFRQVIVRHEDAGETASGFKKSDVIIDVEELLPRIREYGGGFSTDTGPLGFIDLRNVNLFGKLRQGAVRARISTRQQILRLEYLDPRFVRYGPGHFAPLAISAQYQRDSTVTRFFRTTLDRANFGIVQCLDEEGKPIECFDPQGRPLGDLGRRTGEPTINRFTFNIESRRVLDQQSRTVLFGRYSYEDVRLFNIESLLIAPILRPDRITKISRFGATLVRDTRERCVGVSPRLQRAGIIGAPEPCEYSASDPTRGEYLTLDYSVAVRQLGGNLSFNKLLTNYRRYYRIDRVRGTVLAGGFTFGLAQQFGIRDRNQDGVIDSADEQLPISERFFAGGSTTLRGFGFEEAGPRVVIPGGMFRNREGELVQVKPFLVPIGGNAMAVTNLEARVAVTKLIQVVPFYDGGNVFRTIGDLFGRKPKAGVDPNLRVRWTHTVGLGFRIRTPFGGAIAIDYGFLLNPPAFTLPPEVGGPATIRLRRGQLHFRFTQAF